MAELLEEKEQSHTAWAGTAFGEMPPLFAAVQVVLITLGIYLFLLRIFPQSRLFSFLKFFFFVAFFSQSRSFRILVMGKRADSSYPIPDAHLSTSSYIFPKLIIPRAASALSCLKWTLGFAEFKKPYLLAGCKHFPLLLLSQWGFGAGSVWLRSGSLPVPKKLL